MSESQNPYNPREPVFSEEMFFGRMNEMTSVLDFLKTGQSVSMVGPKRIGKTSLILQLMRSQSASVAGTGPDALLVHMDCSSLVNLDSPEVMRQFSSALLSRWKTLGRPEEPALEAACTTPSYAAFEAAIRAIHNRGHRIILILDAFEALSANARIDTRFFNALRSIAGRYRLSFLTASAAALIQLTFSGPAQDFLSSPFFNIFATVNLGLMSVREAMALIRRPAEKAGRPFPSSMQRFLHRLSGGHPYLLQTACSLAFSQAANLEGVERNAARELQPFFESIWQSLSTSERRVLLEAPAQHSKGKNAGEPPILHDLMRKCLLVDLRGHYIYPSKAWADFLARNPQ